MAYNHNNLSCLAYSNGFSQWHYKTPDWFGDVLRDGYFNDAAAMLRAGDFIALNAGLHDEQGPRSGMLCVESNQAGKVRLGFLLRF